MFFKEGFRPVLLLDFIKSGFEGRHNLKRAIFNSSWLLAEKIFRSVISLFVIIWIGRYLGPEQYGIYNYVFAYIVIFSSIASVGIDGVLIRELVKNPGSKQTIMGSAFLIKMAGGYFNVVKYFLTV